MTHFGATSGREDFVKLCREVLAPLVIADGGTMFLVSVSPDEVHIHLAGTCCGCPGASLTRDYVMAPAIQTLLPKAKLRVTTGKHVPDGAVEV